MALDDSYLVYPHRSYGMDQDRYAWRIAPDRPRLVLPGDATLAVAIVVPIEHHPLDPTGKPFKHPGAMQTPYPDLRHYTTRDYGNRVGVYRILDALAARGLTATFPINAASLERFRPLIDAIVAGGHEVAAYGLSTTQIHWGGLDRATEAAWVKEVRQRFDDAGLTPRTWMSPARQQSFATLDLIADAGFDVCLDWEQDSVPVAMKTTTKPVIAVPISNELDDRLLLVDRKQAEDEWADQIIAAADYLQAESPVAGPQVLGFTLTPYVSGQPFRIAALRRILDVLSRGPRRWCAHARAIADVATFQGPA